MRNRTRKTGVAVAAMALLLAIPLQAQAKSTANRGTGSRTTTIQVHAHYTELPGDLGATCLLVVTPDCRLRYAGKSTYTGTMWGRESYDIQSSDEGIATKDGHLTYEGHGTITGGIVGCGTGSYTFYGKGYIDFSRFDPVTQSAPGYDTWRLLPESGTGQLTNLVSGHGVNNWTFYAVGKNGDPKQSGEGKETGTITCRT